MTTKRTEAGSERSHEVDDDAKGEGSDGVHGEVGRVEREAVGGGACVCMECGLGWWGRGRLG